MNTNKKYDESSIKRFAGLQGIRAKPAVYVGPMDSNGLWTIFREPADNCVDQALAGRNKEVTLVFDPTANRYWVVDAGEGIPVGKKEFADERGKKEKLSTFYVVTGLTHGGGNFTGDNISRGTHGIGIKATNALSNYFKVWTKREGVWNSIEYAKGVLKKDVKKDTPPKMPYGIKPKCGTIVCFEPDLSLFAKKSAISSKDVREWCQLTSYLVPKLSIKVYEGKEPKVYHSKNGVSDFIAQRVKKLECELIGKPFVMNTKEVDIAIAFSDADGDDLIYASTNGLRNKEGGEHLRAFFASMMQSLKPYMGKNKFGVNDLKDGILGLVNFKLSAPQFNNQNKDKLIDSRVYSIALEQLVKGLSAYWASNKTFAKSIVLRASELRKKTQDFLKDKKLIKNVGLARKKMSAKLGDVNGKVPREQCEIFIVEGDSAGGGAKRARDKNFQAIYPIQGKPLNVMEAPKAKVNENAEIAGLLAALGIDMKSKNPTATVRYGKIISLADPDVDGQHINCLILAFLWKYLPALFKQGKVFVVKAPLYKGRYKDKLYFGMTKEEVYKKSGSTKTDVQYIKGWGEIKENELYIALDPKFRTLRRIMPPSTKELRKEFHLLMGKDSAFRKQLFGVQ